MFNVGDKVVYPMHGAGIIEAVEEKEVLGQCRKYYILRMPLGDMKVMVPVDNVDEVGLRSVIRSSEIPKVLKVLKEGGIDPAPINSWNRRYRANMEKMKSGDIFEVAKVVRSLSVRERQKGLSTGERRMLETARHILISELVLAKGGGREEVESWLEAAMV
ncbi:MAG: CarD family transcriptional regulator [Clostridia bacterium]|nr:CarD family transcriptional regulator [Clostridia bacterium]